MRRRSVGPLGRLVPLNLSFKFGGTVFKLVFAVDLCLDEGFQFSNFPVKLYVTEISILKKICVRSNSHL